MLDRYAAAAVHALGEVTATQGDALEEAAGLVAASVAAGGVLHLFGAGHSSSWPSTPTPGPAGWPASTRSSTRPCPRPPGWSWPGSSGPRAGPRPSWLAKTFGRARSSW